MLKQVFPFSWIRTQAKYYKKLRRFHRERSQFERLSKQQGKRFTSTSMPCLDDRQTNTGFDRHYVYHTAWAARILAQTQPSAHIDIGSMLYFSTLVSAFLPVTFYDYRPVQIELSGLEAKRADLLALPFPDRSIASLSCMHVVEHVGLGRYGDPLDPQGDLKALRELQRVLAKDGDLLLVVPVGQPKLVFNAHRIYAYREIVESLPSLALHQFALIPDKKNGPGLILQASESQADAQEYGCGCFWFKG